MDMSKYNKENVSGFVELARVQGGILLRVRVSPDFETFIKSLGDGIVHAPEAYGMGATKWKATNGKQLEVYTANPQVMETLMTNQRFRLDLPGQGLEVDATLGYISNINLSFLRVKGISDPNGIEILFADTVMSKTGLLDIRDRIVRSIKYLYAEYVKPASVQGIIYETFAMEG